MARQLWQNPPRLAETHIGAVAVTAQPRLRISSRITAVARPPKRRACDFLRVSPARARVRNFGCPDFYSQTPVVHHPRRVSRSFPSRGFRQVVGRFVPCLPSWQTAAACPRARRRRRTGRHGLATVAAGLANLLNHKRIQKAARQRAPNCQQLMNAAQSR